MEPVRFWAAVEFTAQNGSVEALLSEASAQGLHPYGVSARPGGFCAHCAAWQYRQFAALARKLRVRLRVHKRQGLDFIFASGPCCGGPGSGRGWRCSCRCCSGRSSMSGRWIPAPSPPGRPPGRRPFCGQTTSLTEAKLTAGEYALLQSGEFSWASLNFAKGRLVVEAAAAKPKPDIAAGTLHGIRAKCGGTVVRTNLVSGTMLVVPGQQVEAGQGLIGTARAERDGTLIFAPAAGTVTAQFEWSDTRQVLLKEDVLQRSGAVSVEYELLLFGHHFALPATPAAENAASQTRHFAADLFGLPLPCSVQEACWYAQQPAVLCRTEEQAAALARLQSLQALKETFPDAEIVARKEDCTTSGDALDYTVTYTIVADICA